MKVNLKYYDLEKEEVYYKILSNGTLMVMRCISYSGELSEEKKRRDCPNCTFADYENIVIPPIVDGMKVTALEECNILSGLLSYMTNVTLPDTLMSVGKNLIYFYNTIIPSSVTDLFYDWVFICEDVVLPPSLKSIGQMSTCRRVTIPKSVKRIDRIVGENTLVLECSIPPKLIECDVDADSKLFVPEGAMETYKKDPQWGKFKCICEVEEKAMKAGKKQQEKRKEQSVRSGNRFVFNGKEYKTKGRLCHDIVKYYAEQNPNSTLTSLQKVFNTATNLIVVTPELALATKNSDGKAGGDYYMKEEDMITIRNGKVVVWSYWPERYFAPFMEIVNELGYSIEEIQ